MMAKELGVAEVLLRDALPQIREGVNASSAREAIKTVATNVLVKMGVLAPDVGRTDAMPTAAFRTTGSAARSSILVGDGFFISYNDHDTVEYGCDTTALVIGQMEKFHILKGDHRAQYAPLVSLGLDACLSYFAARPGDAHKFSDRLDPGGPVQ